MRFRLEVSKRAARVSGFTADENGKPLTPILEADAERFERIPKMPAYFHPKYGTYAEIAKEAERLNKIQLTSGFVDYLFYPEIDSAVAADPISPEEWVDIVAKIA